MRYFCCDRARLDVIKLAGTANGIEFLEVRDHLEPIRALRQRTLFVRLLRPGFTLTPDNVRDRRRRAPRRRFRSNGWPPPTTCRPAPIPRWSTASTTCRARWWSAPRCSATSRATRCICAPAPAATSRPPVSTRCCREIDFSFKVECPSDFDCAAELPLPAAARGQRRTSTTWPRTTRLSPPDARPAEPARARLERALRRRRRRRCWSSCWPTRPTTCRIGRTRSPTRPISPPRASACRCAAMRGWSTTRCTTAATRARGCRSRSTADQRCRKGTPLLTRSGGLAGAAGAGQQGRARRARRRRHGVRDGARRSSSSRDLNELSFYTWGDLGCCLPRGATHATLRGEHPDAEAPDDVLVFEEVRSPTTFTAGRRRPRQALGGAAHRV